MCHWWAGRGVLLKEAYRKTLDIGVPSFWEPFQSFGSEPNTLMAEKQQKTWDTGIAVNKSGHWAEHWGPVHTGENNLYPSVFLWCVSEISVQRQKSVFSHSENARSVWTVGRNALRLFLYGRGLRVNACFQAWRSWQGFLVDHHIHGHLVL